mgnify:CR=1 FL=1
MLIDALGFIDENKANLTDWNTYDWISEIEILSSFDVNVDAPVEDVDVDIEEDEITVDEAATELLFEAEDVAELIAEVTGEPVDVTVDDSEVVFAVGDDEFTVTPEGDEEIVEQSTRIRKSEKSVRANRSVRPARRVAASRKVAARRIRK